MTTKPTTLITTRLKQLLDERLLTQGEFALSIDASLERVRNMTCNRIQKLTTREKQAIKAVYNINPDWFTNEAAEKNYPVKGDAKLTAQDKTFEARMTAILLKDLKSNGPLTQQICSAVRQFGRPHPSR